MTSFLVAAAGLVALALLLLLRPWWSRRADGPAARDLRRRVYLDQVDELARDRAAGLVDEADAEAARAELQRRWLEDDSESIESASAVSRAAGTAADARGAHGARDARRGDRTPWLLALALPLLGAAGYAWLGHPDGIGVRAMPPVSTAADARAAAASASAPVTATTIEQMVGRLASRLREHPDDPAGWTRLARAYRVMGRASDARDAYEHVGPTLQDDATMLAEYADTIAALHGGTLDPAASRALRRALEVDPRNPMALSLAATVAWNAKDYPEAARRWRTLLQVLPPDAHDADTTREFLARAEAASGRTKAASRPGRAASR